MELDIATVLALLFFALFIERNYRVYQLKNQIKQLLQDKEAIQNNIERTTGEPSEINLIRDRTNDSHDPLTHLVSKSTFDEIFSQLLQQSERFKKSFALLVLKIDHFEEFNQKNGSAISDKLLIEFAGRIKPSIRQVDTLARYAGDMFAILMPNIATPETAVYVAQRLLDNAVLPFTVDDQLIHLTACVGISIYPNDANNPNTLIQNAEKALNKARSNGSNIFQFYQEQIQTLGKTELSLKSMVMDPHFLENLILDYVPYINTITNEEICIEVVPWAKHSELGNIPYSKFYKFARNAGIIFSLYETIIRRAVAHFKSLQQASLAPKQLMMTVNLNDIQSTELVTRLVSLIHTLEIEPEKIILELTDNIDEVKQENLQQSLLVLKNNKLHVAVGIFVLGHFALQKITNLPIHYLKINNELIKDFHTQFESQSILVRLLAIAQKMEIGVFTAGVTKEEQKKRLQEIGCYIMQGDKSIIHKDKMAI